MGRTQRVLGLAALAGALAAFLTLAVWAQNRPKVAINAGLVNLKRSPNLYFDRYHPPKEMKEHEAAYTQGTVWCQTEADAQAKIESGRKNAPCIARITIQGVAVLVRGEIAVYLPNPPPRDADPEYQNWKVLEAHEEGHARIYSEIFAQFARPASEAVFSKSPSSFNISIPSCNEREIRSGMDRELDILLDALTAETVSKITAAFRQANEEYDRATDHGRKGAEGGQSTVENQAQAAAEAIKQFQKNYTFRER